MSKAELCFHVISYINYLMIDGKEDVDMDTVMDVTKLSKYHRDDIERLCKELAYHIKNESDGD